MRLHQLHSPIDRLGSYIMRSRPNKGLELCSLVPTCDLHEPLVSFPSRRKRYLLISKNTMRDLGFEIHAVRLGTISCSC